MQLKPRESNPRNYLGYLLPDNVNKIIQSAQFATQKNGKFVTLFKNILLNFFHAKNKKTLEFLK